jgi:uncharacterized membrane protein
MNHHRMFTHIKHTDATLMLLNLLLLLFIVLVPFPTALVAEYLKVPNSHYAAALFNGTYVMIAICFNLLLRYATRKHRLLGKQVDQQEIEAMLRQYRFGPVAYLITFGLTWISVPASLILNLLMAVFWALPGRKLRFKPKSSASSNYEAIITSEQASASRIDDHE